MCTEADAPFPFLQCILHVRQSAVSGVAPDLAGSGPFQYRVMRMYERSSARCTVAVDGPPFPVDSSSHGLLSSRSGHPIAFPKTFASCFQKFGALAFSKGCWLVPQAVNDCDQAVAQVYVKRKHGSVEISK